MTTKPIIIVCLFFAAICVAKSPLNNPTNVTGYVVGTGICETKTVTETNTTKKSVPLTFLELAEMKPVPKAFSNRPNVWERTGKEITLYNYKFTGKDGTLLSVTIVPTNALEGNISYAVLDKSSKKR